MLWYVYMQIHTYNLIGISHIMEYRQLTHSSSTTLVFYHSFFLRYSPSQTSKPKVVDKVSDSTNMYIRTYVKGFSLHSAGSVEDR